MVGKENEVRTVTEGEKWSLRRTEGVWMLMSAVCVKRSRMKMKVAGCGISALTMYPLLL